MVLVFCPFFFYLRYNRNLQPRLKYFHHYLCWTLLENIFCHWVYLVHIQVSFINSRIQGKYSIRVTRNLYLSHLVKLYMVDTCVSGCICNELFAYIFSQIWSWDLWINRWIFLLGPLKGHFQWNGRCYPTWSTWVYSSILLEFALFKLFALYFWYYTCACNVFILSLDHAFTRISLLNRNCLLSNTLRHRIFE